MQPLRDLQREFAQALRYPAAPVPAVRDRGLSPSQRLQVYRNNSHSALSSALRSVYPATERLVGEEFFAAAAHDYLQANPSHSGNIQDYGGAFPEFLHGFAPAASVPYLADVARLEWDRVQAALAPAHTPLDLAALARVPAELQPELHFSQQPACRILGSDYPVLAIWEFCQASEDADGLNIGGPGECVLIARPRLDVYARRLTAGEFCFLTSLSKGAAFAAACAEALQAEPGFDVVARFGALVQEEILTGFFL
jgi:hypothetical protein